MKHIIAACCLIVSLSAFGQDFDFDYQRDFQKILTQSNDSTSERYYNTLLQRYNDQDETLDEADILSLLIGFTDNKHFKPYSYLPTEREIYKLNDEGKFVESIALCDSFLAVVPVSQQALIEKSYAFYKLGNADSSGVYMWRFRKIMEAMAASGDGLTPETAIFALGPADGQNFIRKYLSSGIGMMGSGQDENGNFLDILDRVWEDEESGEKKNQTLYFQIEHATKTMFGDLFPDEKVEETTNGRKRKRRQKKNK